MAPKRRCYHYGPSFLSSWSVIHMAFVALMPQTLCSCPSQHPDYLSVECSPNPLLHGFPQRTHHMKTTHDVENMNDHIHDALDVLQYALCLAHSALILYLRQETCNKEAGSPSTHVSPSLHHPLHDPVRHPHRLTRSHPVHLTFLSRPSHPILLRRELSPTDSL